MSWYNPLDWGKSHAADSIDAKPQHFDDATAQLGQAAQSAQSRSAPYAAAAGVQAAQLGPAAQLAQGQMDQSRGGLMGVANQLGSIASGQQAGAGELAVNRQIGSALAAQNSAARMARGAQAALAYHNAARNSADIGLAGAGQAAQAQMADQQGALGQLGQVYGGMYGQDTNVANANAQLGQQAMLQQGAFQQQANLQGSAQQQQTQFANQGAALQQRQMNDTMQIQALGQQLGWDQAKINAELAKAGLQQQDTGLIGGLLSAGGTIGAAYAGRK